MKIFLALLLLFALLLSLSFSLDESAMQLHDESFNRAMVAFGLAKGLNAIISLIQGTQLSFTPVGIGMTFSVGEVLDPFNDMVERFSWVMLFASVSLGIQKLLLLLSSKMFLQVALVASGALSIFFLFRMKLQTTNLFLLSMKVFTLLLLLRFAAIFFVYTSEYFYNSVLSPEYQNSTTIIENTRAQLQEIQNQNTKIVNSQKESGFFSGVSSKYSDLMQSLNISQQLERLQISVEDASVNIIKLITIFIVQSVLIPLLFLLFFITLVKWIFKMKFENEKLFFFLNEKSAKQI